MNFGISTSVKSREVQLCTPALLDHYLDSPLVARICAEIADAREKKLEGALTSDEFETIKQQMKQRLPVLTPHATFRGGRRKNAEAIPSGLSMYDIDHIANPIGRWEQIAPRAKELGILLAHITPSCEGLRLFFLIPQGMDLPQAQQWMASQLGDGQYDAVCKDLARCSFLVPREYLLYFDSVRLFCASGENADDAEGADERRNHGLATVFKENADDAEGADERRNHGLAIDFKENRTLENADDAEGADERRENINSASLCERSQRSLRSSESHQQDNTDHADERKEKINSARLCERSQRSLRSSENHKQDNTDHADERRENINSASLCERSQRSLRSSENHTLENRTLENAEESYLGIPYRDIIRKWWEMYHEGKEPVKSNRDVLTFELAVNLRHICGFDRQLMDHVIPCYDGFPQEQKMKCIDSALAERRTQLPRRLRDVLIAAQRDRLREGEGDELPLTGEGWEEGLGDLYHYDRLPKLPLGVRDSIEAAGHPLAMPTLIAIAPAIGALATGVKLDVHGKARGLNLCSFITGDFASGKGQLDDVIAAWMEELQAEADLYTQQEEEWAAKAKRMKSGKAPEQPKLPVRLLTLNNTVANLAERLANTEGKHSFSFTPEADNVALKWKQSVSDFSVMLRQAYDEARYDREAKSAEAVRVHIDKLLWNVTMCGTQDALYRVVTNYTDGLLSRLAIARTPDNTFAPLAEHPAQMTSDQRENIRQVAHLLPLMSGEVCLPKLEERGRQWLETIRKEALKNDDRVLARQRFRGCVNAQRITAALWLPKVAEQLISRHGLAGAEVRLKRKPTLWIEQLHRLQTEEMLTLFDLVADYLLDNDLYFFRDRIAQAYEARDYQGDTQALRTRKGRNDSIFARLQPAFSFDQALQQTMALKGPSATRNSVHQMLKNWRKQGLVSLSTDGLFHKV